MFRLLALPLLAVALIGPCRADSDGMVRTAAVYLWVDAIDADGKNCGLSESLVREAFMYPISNSKIKLGANIISAPTFEISILTLRSGAQLCFSSVNISLHEHTIYLDFFTKNTVSVDDLIWSDRYAAFAELPRHSQQMRELIENAVKKFITEWNLVHQN